LVLKEIEDRDRILNNHKKQKEERYYQSHAFHTMVVENIVVVAHTVVGLLRVVVVGVDIVVVGVDIVVVGVDIVVVVGVDIVVVEKGLKPVLHIPLHIAGSSHIRGPYQSPLFLLKRIHE
jgi:hypothetical protein